MNTELTGYLTPKQQKFCDEYLTDLNATRAALRAGYSGSTALSGALMRMPKIAAYIQQRTEAASREAQVTHQMVLAELAKIAFSNMRNYYHSDGRMKGAHELTDDQAAALWCMKVTDEKAGQTSFIRLNNKLSALEKIAKHLGFYYAEAEAPEKEYVIIEKDKLTADDRFDDASLVEVEEEEEDDELDEEGAWAEFSDETPLERMDRMHSERHHVLHFYPALDKILPSPRHLTDAMITAALRRVARSPQESHVVAAKRENGPELGVIELTEEERMAEDGRQKGSEVRSPQSESEEDLEIQEQATATKRTGGVIDFGKKPEEVKKPSGRCEVPHMMGNSREYRSW